MRPDSRITYKALLLALKLAIKDEQWTAARYIRAELTRQGGRGIRKATRNTLRGLI